MDLIKDIESILTSYLEGYFSGLHDKIVNSEDNVIEISCKKQKDDIGYFILLRLGINETNEEIYIYNIFLPNEDRGKGIGLGLIAVTFEIAKAIGFALVLYNMVDGFREAMLKRGAIPTTIYDCLQVVETTILT